MKQPCSNARKWCGLALMLPLAAAAQTYSKTETIEYHDDTTLWVLGQIKRGTTNSIETGKTTFGWKALPIQTDRFGKTVQVLTYDSTSTVASGQLGTLKTAADGNHNITTFGSWKRGVPQSIVHADTSTESAVVNDTGWITSVTDEAQSKTCYEYDAMGRIAKVTYTSETAANTCDASTWAITTQSFSSSTVARYGLPVGYWVQSVDTGYGRIVRHFDAMWRPVLEEQFDNTNSTTAQATRTMTVKRYDDAGRLEFQSYPVASLTTINDAGLTGTWTTYDGLGRVKSVSQDSELGLLTTLTEYQTGFKTQITSPKGQVNTTSFAAYDQPSTDWPVMVAHPEGAYTHITRDVFGKPTQIRRSDSASPSGGTIAVNRIYAYQSDQLLCKSIEPETGTTVYGYDAAGNLVWSAAGLNLPDASQCNQAEAWASGRFSYRIFDQRNRLTTLIFPDGRGNQAWTYTPTGLPASITTYNNTGNTEPVVNAYGYNRRQMLTGETSGQTGWYTWGLGYGYNSYGHLHNINYPDGLSIVYAPNGIGQPTQAGTYASNVQYYPNGALKQFTYGNGIVHTMTQNARQLPARSIDSGGVLDLSYAYDSHANVAGITDGTVGARQSRAMTYDGLDRLRQTTGPSFGTASYSYDALDNLRTLNVTGGTAPRNHTYVYDPSHRLTSITNTVGGATVVGLSYDLQGNLANKNGQLYQFDYGNRLRNVPGKEWYRYDGHGRRVYSFTSTYSVWQYGHDGKLYYSHDARNNRASNYIYLQGSLLATREGLMAGGDGTYTVKYQHTDALGTPIKTTNAAGATIETSEYEPYGQLANRPLTDGPGFTGHVQDAVTGLTYMQQRYYDPQIGRFLSVDPITAYSNPSGAFNRYWYANNNPYKFIDPDGRKASRGKDEYWDQQSYKCQKDPTCKFSLGDTQKEKPQKDGEFEERQIVATRLKIIREQGEGLREAGKFAAKESAINYTFARFARPLSGLWRFLRIGDDAAKIASGHAFQKHGKEFMSLGIKTENDFARHIDDIIRNSTMTKNLERGRTAFWDGKTGTVVIRDPNSADGGAAFIPVRGVEYFNGLK